MSTVTTEINGQPQARIRVLIADDHSIIRDGLKRLLQGEEDMEAVGEAKDGQETMEMIRNLEPDVVLLDLRMPVMDGWTVLRQLQQMQSRTKCLVLTASEDRDEYVQAMQMGCYGIVVKHSSADHVLKSIRKVHTGEIWLDSQTTAAVMQKLASLSAAPVMAASAPKSRPTDVLSPRELEIVRMVTQGHRNKEIATQLRITEQTVKNHLHNIFSKLMVSDRLELALFAIHNGLIGGQESDQRRITPSTAAASSALSMFATAGRS